MNEYEYEPVPGLPEHLPQSEQIVWQGHPQWRSLAIHTFHLRKVTLYFSALIGFSVFSNYTAGTDSATILSGLAWQLSIGLTCIALLALLARAYAKSTLYTVTNERLVMRYGVALPMMINIPWSKVSKGDLQTFSDGTGNLALTPTSDQKVSYLMVWPHVRAWRWNPVCPTLKSIPDPQSLAVKVASMLTNRGSHQTNELQSSSDSSPIESIRLAHGA